jgi:hypothetical protein
MWQWRFCRLFLAKSTQSENTNIYAGSLDSQERKLLINADSNPIYAPPGFLLFRRGQTLMGQRFDADKLELQGEPFPVADQIDYSPRSSRGFFSASQTGALTYGRPMAAASFSPPTAVNGAGSAFTSGVPKVLFELNVISTAFPGGGSQLPYAATRDGQRFIVNTILGDSSQVPITVVLNWTADLKRWLAQDHRISMNWRDIVIVRIVKFW